MSSSESNGDCWKVTVEQYSKFSDGTYLQGGKRKKDDFVCYVTALTAADASLLAEEFTQGKYHHSRVISVKYVGVSIVAKGAGDEDGEA